ncbi:HIT family protein [Candidatus Eisenbacteria bacterium]|uniref:HIT family protein n=1 Tax=Eiseniibacteriota bacterium TaxID=2212470 RepID=A0ABV6YPP3_UNCEI
MTTDSDRENSEHACPFCQVLRDSRVIASNGIAYAIHDKFPITEGHMLVIPVRHFADFFEISDSEHEAVFDLTKAMRRKLLADDNRITGFNVGVNVGEVAGQTVPHCHIHLIPRRAGDTDRPRGGVRGIIPDKRSY